MRVTSTITIDPEVWQKARQRYKNLSRKVESLLRADLDLPIEEDLQAQKDRMNALKDKLSAIKSMQIEAQRDLDKEKKKIDREKKKTIIL